MEPSDENITSLLSMGFDDIGKVRRALRLAKNDLSEAVSILTGEETREGFDDQSGDIEMRDTQYREADIQNLPPLEIHTDPVNIKQPPPSYEETVNSTADEDCESEAIDVPLESIPDEFPTTHLYELESRIFPENWSIPYRKHESLGKCLFGAIKLSHAGKAENDVNCKRFMERAMPECFQKLLASDAVRRWNYETLEGVYNMIKLFIDLAAIRLHSDPIPMKLLSVLTQAFDPECEYHFKNRTKRWDRAYYEDIFGFQKCPAISLPFSIAREPYGWLINLINRFAHKNGFDAICDRIEKAENLNAPMLAALLQPFGVCAIYLNPEVAGYKLGSVADKAVVYVKELKECDIKEKEIGKVFDLLRTLKLLCQMLWKDKLSYLDELHLATLLNMLKSAHFNARMNALKEICKLIKESEKTSICKTGIAQDTIMQWLLENKVLSIAFQSSLHQHQYCEKLKKVVEFVGSRLSNDELTTIWSMQSGKHNTVIDNIHTIIATAAQSFTSDQLDHLINLLEESWNSEDEKAREKLLLLIGRIGREIVDAKTVIQLLAVVWDLAHVDSLPTYLINQAVQSHLDILTESQALKDGIKHTYIGKCIIDIRDGGWVVPAIRHLLNNLEALMKQPYSKSHKSMLQDLQKQKDLFKMVTNSLMRSHQAAVEWSGQQPLDGSTIIANQYTYGETVMTHLKFIAFVLQDGALYLSFTRVKDIWDCLMLDENNCDGDFETCFQWFTDGITDLEHETQLNLFTSRMLKVDVPRISQKGFRCFKVYFESVNDYEHKIKKTGSAVLVEKQDLTGLSYLWQIVLESPYEDIAEEATQYLIQLSYTLLSPRLKKTDPVNIHKRFIAECYKRLEALLAQLGLNEATTLEGKQIPGKRKFAAQTLDRQSLLLGIKRLLLLACYYITTVEDNFMMPRSFPPHASCFRGFPLSLNVTHEANKIDFELKSHSNETLSSLRRRIAEQLGTSVDSVNISINEKVLTNNKDQKLLNHLNFDDGMTVSVKTISIASSASASAAANALDDEGLKPSSLLEREKGLPGYLMAVEYKVFDKMYELAALEESGIIDALRNLLSLLPTDTGVVDAMEVFASQQTFPSTPNAKKDKSVFSGLFEEYFKFNGPKMSTFRLLYNLQVLSSKLMPTEEKESPASFRKSFLDAGGLSLILNILQPDAIPSNVAYELRQSCYFVCLQLARSLLCEETLQQINLSFASPIKTTGISTSGMSLTTPLDNSATSSMATSTPIKLAESPSKNQSASFASSWPGARSSSPISVSMLSSSPGSSAGVTPDNASEPKRPRAGSLLDSVAPAARMVIEMMNRDDYAETVACLMRVAWAAAAGQLHLNTYRNNKNVDSDKINTLKSGICLTRNEISAMDTILSENAIELLVMCLQLRANLMNVFYYLPNVNEFIIDILIGSPSSQIRATAVRHLTILSETEITEPKVEKSRDFLLRTLLKAPVPVWNPSPYLRGSQYKIHNQCTPYFELLCNLLQNLPMSDQAELKIDPSKMLEDEVAWLSSSSASEPALLLGHLKLIKILFTCEGVDKRLLGKSYIKALLDDFLFTASKFVQKDSSILNETMLESEISCSSKECWIAALEIFVTLAQGCADNLCDIVTQLISRHHSQLSTSKEWEFQPPVAARPTRGFVGLQNGGATCYMNSVIQQLYMQPGIREALLKVDESKTKETEGVFYQMQTIFGHLLEGKMQYYRPEMFWKCFRLWDQPVNVREQQDAFEFFTSITSQLDEQLKKFRNDEIFKKTFCGMFADQKNCKECCHTYEREEEFYSIPVTVKCQTLEKSLEQFVNDEVMEGDNAYYCEKCRENRTTVKRLCIKSLPQVLVIQLKRFWYDWDANRAIKFDDSFQFPWVLDVKPYTSEGMSKSEGKSSTGSEKDLEKDGNQYFYELVGIIVHSGQANAGHYYSYIKNRRSTIGHVNRWYKFNDTSIEEFEMTDADLEAECFGGSYRVGPQDRNSQYPEKRIRNWNAYMLFYEAIDKNIVSNLKRAGSREVLREDLVELRRSIPSSPTSSASSGPPSPGRSDGLSQLSALIRRGEKRGLFNDNIPPSIRRLIHEDNLQFMQNRDVYNEDYFHFMLNLCSCNLEYVKEYLDESQKNIALCSFQLAVQFLFNTYFRTTKKLRLDFKLWCQTLDSLIHISPESCLWFLSLLAGERGKEYLGPYLVECPDKETRTAVCHLLFSACDISMKSGKTEYEIIVDKVIGQLLELVETSVINNSRQSNQYFEFFQKFACINLETLKSLLSKGVFKKLVNFLVGPSCFTNNQRYARRWSSAQAQEFGFLHLTLITLIIQTDTSHKLTVDPAGAIPPALVSSPISDSLVEMPEEMEIIIYGENGERYIAECLYACIEIPYLTRSMADMLLRCCWCNENISRNVIRQSQIVLERVQPNDLKNVLQIFLDLLCMEDPLQSYRVNMAVDGSKECRIPGILPIVKSSHISDPRRSYQCIKLLVTLAQRCSLAKNYLLQNPSRWQWAVDWLKRKMNEYYWTAQPHISNESHSNKSFQRTVSAQYTLDEATALLTEIERQEKAEIQKKSSSPLKSVNQSDFPEDQEEDWDKEVVVKETKDLQASSF